MPGESILFSGSLLEWISIDLRLGLRTGCYWTPICDTSLISDKDCNVSVGIIKISTIIYESNFFIHGFSQYKIEFLHKNFWIVL